MDQSLNWCLDGFGSRRVLVIGEAILDSYLHGVAGRICREAPVPVVTLSERRDAPGGAANTAVNVHTLGGQVEYLSAVGDDHEGYLLRTALQQRGLSCEHLITCRDRQTLAKQRLVANGQILVRFDTGTTTPVDCEIENALIDRLTSLYAECDVVIISDYGYGILTPRVIEALAGLQARFDRVVVADSKYLPAYRNVGVTAIKPNYEEASNLLGYGPPNGHSRAERLAQDGERLLDMTGAQVGAITVDTEGSVFIERRCAPYRTYARPVANSRAVGAGDTFVSALALALGSGANTPLAAEIASAAAAVVVAKEGTATCSLDELREHFTAGGKLLSSAERLAEKLALYRQEGKRIVFTNGCFDILHRGHIDFLNQAKALGDIMVVGVNSDASVERLKGAGRPINHLEDRVRVLAGLSSVDHIIAFEEDTAANLVRAIRPDVFTKGGNYSVQSLPEARVVEEYGGQVQLLPNRGERSTSRIIRRIRDLYSLPAPGQAVEVGEARHDYGSTEPVVVQVVDYVDEAAEAS